MAFAPIPWNVGRKTLSEFSEVALFVFGMIAAPLSLWKGHANTAIAFWSVAVVVRILGWVRPMALKPLFLGLILLGWPIGWLVANALLAVVFFFVVTPLGFFLRRRRGDVVGRRFDRSASSYWVAISSKRDPRDYLRQF